MFFLLGAFQRGIGLWDQANPKRKTPGRLSPSRSLESLQSLQKPSCVCVGKEKAGTMTCLPRPLEGSLLPSPAPPWFLPSSRQEELKDHASQECGPQCCVPADRHQAAGWAVGFEENTGSLSSVSPVGLFCFIEAPKLTGAEGNKHSHEVRRWIQSRHTHAWVPQFPCLGSDAVTQEALGTELVTKPGPRTLAAVCIPPLQTRPGGGPQTRVSRVTAWPLFPPDC